MQREAPRSEDGMRNASLARLVARPVDPRGNTRQLPRARGSTLSSILFVLSVGRERNSFEVIRTKIRREEEPGISRKSHDLSPILFGIGCW